eukprot:Em0001g3258a
MGEDARRRGQQEPVLGPELEPRVSARAAELRVEGQNQNKAESEQGESPAAGEERVPGRKESCRRRGESPAAGEERVLQPGRKEFCRRVGESPAAGEERVLPPGR